MGYELLRAGVRREGLEGVCALAVMSKAPRAGKVKTRLAPTLGFEGSAAINVCFLKDTTRNIAGVCGSVDDGGGPTHAQSASMDGASGDLEARGALGTHISEARCGAHGLVCYTPVGDEGAFDGLLPDEFALIAQRGDLFGERLLAAAEDILSVGYGAVCLIDSDSPTMPTEALQQAVEELAKPGDRVVIGGSDDGGYYLIGLKRVHVQVFENITWSTEKVFAETLRQAKSAGLEVVELPVWYDVDDAATLAVLERELLHGERPEFPSQRAKALVGDPGFATVDGFDATATREFLMRRAAAPKEA